MSSNGINIFAALSVPSFFDSKRCGINSNGEFLVENKDSFIRNSRNLFTTQTFREEAMIETARGIAELAAKKPELIRAPGVDLANVTSNLKALMHLVDDRVKNPERKQQIFTYLDNAIKSLSPTNNWDTFASWCVEQANSCFSDPLDTESYWDIAYSDRAESSSPWKDALSSWSAPLANYVNGKAGSLGRVLGLTTSPEKVVSQPKPSLWSRARNFSPLEWVGLTAKIDLDFNFPKSPPEQVARVFNNAFIIDERYVDAKKQAPVSAPVPAEDDSHPLSPDIDPSAPSFSPNLKAGEHRHPLSTVAAPPKAKEKKTDTPVEMKEGPIVKKGDSLKEEKEIPVRITINPATGYKEVSFSDLPASDSESELVDI